MARPDLGTADIVIDGITKPRSALEQLPALEAADEMLEQLSTRDRACLRAALQSVKHNDTSSSDLVNRLPEVA